MVMDRLQIVPLLAGSVLTIMGLAVGIGWLWQLVVLVQIVPGLAAMAFPTALCFALAGLALIVRALSPRLRHLVLICGVLICGMALFDLIELLSGSSRDIWQAIHAWFNQIDGLRARMSIPTAICFLLGGSALCATDQWRDANRFVKLFGAAVLAIGLIAIAGYALRLESLYHWYFFSYMALHTAVGMVLFGAGLLCIETNILSSFEFSDGGVLATALGVLVGTSLSIGLIFWASGHSNLMTLLSNSLHLAERARAEQIDTIIQLRSVRAATVANRPNLLRSLRRFHDDPGARENLKVALGVLRSYEAFGFSAIRVYALDAHELIHSGTPIDTPGLTVPLDEHAIAAGRPGNTTELLWHNGFYLRHRMALIDAQGGLGVIVTDQALPELDTAVLHIGDLHGSDELLLCAPRGADIDCFPSTYQKEPFTLPRTSADYSMLATTVAQRSGVVETVRDYRNSHVVAAADNVGTTGLFTILKANTAVLYHPLLLQFQRTAILLFALIAIGTLLIYTRVRPLVDALRASEKGLQAALAESNTARIAADDANHAKSLFLSSMSHELRTPLNGVLGYVQMLQDNPNTSPDQWRQLNAIESCGQHLLALINDVLDLSKIESGRIEIESVNCNLYDLLEGVGDIIRQRAHSKGLAYNLDIDKAVPPFVYIDDVKLRQVLVNLLGNAVKFTERGSVTLRVSTRMNNRELLFQVRDTGIGIPPEKQREIFQPFKQIGRSAGGTGLGLSISQRLCEAMGGMLLVQSAIGEGSCFSVNLPLILGEAVKTSGPLRASHPVIDIGARRINVLVADDNAINRQVLTGMLRANGFVTDEVENGEDAIAALHEQRYDLLLMDVRMPVMDGLTATRLIKADPTLHGIKIIVVSASVAIDTIAEMRAAGCDDFIRKPVRVRELLEKVAQYLELPLREVQLNHGTQNHSI